MLLRKAALRLRLRLAGQRVRHRGLTLPARHLRLGGPEFRDDAYFVASAEAEIDRLARHCGLTARSRLLDVGCGVGRLAIGALSRFGSAPGYHGIDVNAGYIAWCRRHLAQDHPELRFTHIDVHNARYNPSRNVIDDAFRLPLGDGSFDVVYLYSVFSHMTTADVTAYLREFARLLAPGGRVFLTAFIEEGVPDCEENPPGYGLAWQGPLHGVRYSRAFFESLAQAQGFAVERFDHGQEANGQSALYLARRRGP